jgi:hypothetical protein
METWSDVRGWRWFTFASDNAKREDDRGGFGQPDDRVKQPLAALLAISTGPLRVD